MICSAAELNSGTDHSGILVLPPGTAEPGDAAVDLLGLDDVVFHLAITPDRGYCLSVRGMAREIACAYDLEFVDPADVPPLPADGEAWPVTVAARHRSASGSVCGQSPASTRPRCPRGGCSGGCCSSGIRANLARRRRHQLRDARVRSPDARPRPQPDHRRLQGSLREPGETVVTLDDVERKLDPARCANRRRRCDRRDRRHHGCGHHRGARHHHRPAARGGGVGSRGGVADPAPAAPDRARRAVATNAPSIQPSPLPHWTVPPRCWPKSRAAQSNPSSPTGAVTRRAWTGLSRRSAWPSTSPDRTAGVDYAEGTTQRRLTQIGADVVADGNRVTAYPTELAARPARARRPGRGGAAAGGPRASSPQCCRTRLLGAASPRFRSAAARSGSLWRSTAIVEVLPTPFLPAGVFDQWGLPADDPRRKARQVLNPLESDRPQLATTLLPGLLEALGRNVSRGARRRRAVRDRRGRRVHLSNPCRRAHSRTTAGPPTTRSPHSTRRCRVSHSTSAW